jgi:hypothetical protein
MSNSGRSSNPDQARPELEEDTVMRRLSRKDKDRMGVDSWEPSLLRKMLRARDGKTAKTSDL